MQDVSEDLSEALQERASGLSMVSEPAEEDLALDTTTVDWTSDDPDAVVISRLMAAFSRVSGTHEEVRAFHSTGASEAKEGSPAWRLLAGWPAQPGHPNAQLSFARPSLPQVWHAS